MTHFPFLNGERAPAEFAWYASLAKCQVSFIYCKLQQVRNMGQTRSVWPLQLPWLTPRLSVNGPVYTVRCGAHCRLIDTSNLNRKFDNAEASWRYQDTPPKLWLWGPTELLTMIRPLRASLQAFRSSFEKYLSQSPRSLETRISFLFNLLGAPVIQSPAQWYSPQYTTLFHIDRLWDQL